MLKRTAKKGGKRILLAWNRGLGDIALGLFAMLQRIREFIPQAEITFLIRENLSDGFSLLEGAQTIVAPQWVRGQKVDVKETLRQLGVDPKKYDLLIANPSPTDWVPWQRGKVVPRLQWKSEGDVLWKKFNLADGYTYIGVQVVAETNYGLWRNWPQERWQELFERVPEKVRILLFGFGNEPQFNAPNIIDLRGKTTLFELLSIIKNRCTALVLPDSGILSMTYYLDASFPIRLISLWADPNHGILKQAVSSPNPQLIHCPLIGTSRDLSTVSVNAVLERLFPLEPLKQCARVSDVPKRAVKQVGCIILAGGQGTRLGIQGPKGLFEIEGKPLFQWICEKAEKGSTLAIMTSPLNHEETVNFFKRHAFFGLDLYFFQQEIRPLLDDEKRPIARKGEIVQGPSGNGSVFRSFAAAGLRDVFQKKGIDVVTVIPVENPLASPFDAALIAHHRDLSADVTIKCIERQEEENTVGVLGVRGGKIEILEYTEIEPLEWSARANDGALKYRFANTGQFALSLSFLSQMASVDLPTHWVQKKMQIGAQTVPIWKGEHFIFDAFRYAKRVEALCFPKESCYAPLKCQSSLFAVQKALQKMELRT